MASARPSSEWGNRMNSHTTFDPERISLDAPRQHPVEVFCVGSHITGVMHSMRPRVGNHLEAEEQVLEIADATLDAGPGAPPFVEHHAVYINKPKVLFVLDLTPEEWASGGSDLEFPGEAHAVFVSVGEFWISGQLVLPVGGDVHDYLARSPRQFVPISNADILGYDERTPCSVLVNRDHLEAVVERPSVDAPTTAAAI